MHYDRDTYGKPLKRRESKTTDARIVHLIWLVKEVVSMIRIQKDRVQSEISHGIQNELLPILLESLKASSHGDDLKSAVCHYLQEFISGTDWNEELEIHSISNHLLYSWLRYEHYALASPPSFPAFGQMSKLLLLAPFLDDFQCSCNDLASLKGLFYHQNSLLDHLKLILDSDSDLLKYVDALGVVGSDFEDIVTTLSPSLLEWNQAQTICYVTEVYSVLGYYCAHLTHAVALITISHQCQSLSSESVKSFPKFDKIKSKEKKKKIEVVISQRPGVESQFNGRDCEFLNLKKQLRWLVLSLFHRESIQVNAVDVSPFEFFMESLCTNFKAYMNIDVVIGNDSITPYGKNEAILPFSTINKEVQALDDALSFDIKRPSVFHGQLKAYLASVAFIDQLTHMDCTKMLKNVWDEQNNIEQVQRIAESFPDNLIFAIRPKNNREKQRAAIVSSSHPFLISYIRWYTEFLVTKTTTGTCIYSPSHRAFCNVEQCSIQAEHYTDQNELESLCQLIGLSGYHFMDEKISRMITIQFAGLEETMDANFDVLNAMKVSNLDWDTLGKMSCMNFII